MYVIFKNWINSCEKKILSLSTFFSSFFLRKSMHISFMPCLFLLLLWVIQHNREFQQEFTKHLPTIYQWFTKDLPKIRPYLAFYLLKTYQGFTKDLPKTYQRFTKSTKHLPKAIKYFFNLPKIYQQFTKNVWTKIFWYFYMYFLKNI